MYYRCWEWLGLEADGQRDCTVRRLAEEVEACETWAWSRVARQIRQSWPGFWQRVVGLKWLGCRSSCGAWSDSVVFGLGVWLETRGWLSDGGGDGRGLSVVVSLRS